MAQPASAPVVAEPPPPVPDPPPPTEPSNKRTPGLALMISGIPLVAIGAPMIPIGLSMRYVAQTEADFLQGSGADPSYLESVEQRARRGTGVAVVGGALLVVGVPLLVSGIVLIRRHENAKDHARHSVQPNLAFGRHGASAGVHMRF